MDLKDMILVTENDRGTETNMLMTLDDYKSFIAVDDMSELADNLLQLGRTLGKADNFTEYYRAANVTVSARFCLDDIQLGQFLQGFYNDSKEFRFDKEASSSECVAKLKQKFYFYQDMSKDDDVPKKLQNDFLHQMYEDFGTIEEDCFYDRLEDGKYDEGFKERQVKEEKCR